jgi:2-polyprenyl-3-methyl-5-hydroxy-6-metoxy-1,4-benzoquinol methylase
MNTRIYDEKININYESTKSFWETRAGENVSLKSVLLGVDKKDDAQERRNKKELEILISFLKEGSKYKILDIGCGIGRWADNLKNIIENYIGIDYTKPFVNFANNRFSGAKNIHFECMSASDIDLNIIGKDFNLVLCTGILMYINDKDLDKVFLTLQATKSDYFYIQETISIMDTRLTLNNFESKELKTNYSAIYRTKSEYEEYFKRHNLEILDANLFLDDETGGRKETNARYWLLKRG